MSSSKTTNTPTTTYRDAGVDIDAGNALVEEIKPLVKQTHRTGVAGNLGGFGGLFDLKPTGYKDPILVAATDGVGTKLKIAIDTDQHETIGIDLVAMCVNDLVVQGAEPLFFLDYFATSKLNVAQGRDIVAGIAEGCKQSGAALLGGETAEMPGMYQSGDYDLAGFCVGAVERGQMLPRKDFQVGDTILGLPSNGIHSNGYSLVRKLVEKAGLSWQDKAPWDATNQVASSLLAPTKIYVKSLLDLLQSQSGSSTRGFAHITGGGLSENIPRVLPENVNAQVDLDSWPLPPVFGWLAKTGNLDQTEMLRTFNCGIGMIAVVAKDAVDDVIATLEKSGQPALKIGSLVSGNGAPVVEYEGTFKVS